MRRVFHEAEQSTRSIANRRRRGAKRIRGGPPGTPTDFQTDGAASPWRSIFPYTTCMDVNSPKQSSSLGADVPVPPGALPFFRIDNPRVRRFADLALHRKDLAFALKSVESIGAQSKIDGHLREALWRSAIVHYFKCFGKSAARFQLQATQVYKGQPATALQAFEHFHNLRNRHYIHDENAFQQCTVAVALGDGEKYCKVAAVIPFMASVNVCTDENIACMRQLITCAIMWVDDESRKREAELRAYLETISHEELTRHPGISAYVPGADDTGNRR